MRGLPHRCARSRPNRQVDVEGGRVVYIDCPPRVRETGGLLSCHYLSNTICTLLQRYAARSGSLAARAPGLGRGMVCCGGETDAAAQGNRGVSWRMRGCGPGLFLCSIWSFDTRIDGLWDA